MKNGIEWGKVILSGIALGFLGVIAIMSVIIAAVLTA